MGIPVATRHGGPLFFHADELLLLLFCLLLLYFHRLHSRPWHTMKDVDVQNVRWYWLCSPVVSMELRIHWQVTHWIPSNRRCKFKVREGFHYFLFTYTPSFDINTKPSLKHMCTPSILYYSLQLDIPMQIHGKLLPSCGNVKEYVLFFEVYCLHYGVVWCIEVSWWVVTNSPILRVNSRIILFFGKN